MEQQVKRGELLKVPFQMLSLVDGLNLREDYGDLKELAASIKENGVKVPLRGYKERGEEKYIVVDGHRRFKACELLNGEGVDLLVPFIIQEKGTTDEQMVFDMFLTNDGKPLTPVEQAEGIARLKAYGYETKDIAQRLGKSGTYIENLFKLSQAPKKAKNLVKKGIVSATFIIHRMKDETIEEFLSDHETWLDQHEIDDFGNIESKDKKVSKQAKITEKDVQLNSFKEFKKFSKAAPASFPTKEIESQFWFAVDLVANQITFDEMLNYFTDGTDYKINATNKTGKKLTKKAAKK